MDKSGRFLSELAQQHRPGLQQDIREQFGALCYRIHETSGQIEVLLITTRESHRWTIPKGWPMAGKKGHQVARQEALEEAGVRGKISKKVFGRFTYLKFLADGQRVPCMVQVHLLRVENTVEQYKESGQRDLLWCTCFEAAVKVSEPELKGLFRLLYERRGRPSS